MNKQQQENIQELVEIAQEIGAKVQTIEAERLRCFVMKGDALPVAFDVDGPLVLVLSFGDESE